MEENNQEIKWHGIGEKFILLVIFINSIVIYLQVGGEQSIWLEILDIACSVIFIIEMIVKHRIYGVRGYWSDGWNRMDGILVILSIPSLFALIFNSDCINLSALLILRLFRTLRFFRFIHFFGGGITQISRGFKRALIASRSVMAAFFLIIVIFGLVNCSMFQDVAPQYFKTPLQSIYSIFQLFTVEGWYDIPNAVADGVTSPVLHAIVKIYFCLLLVAGGIMGMSFINSVFVDAMAEDNNDDVKEQLKQMEKKIDELTRLIENKK